MVYVCGFLMALADSVPGVSGGTIAFLLGYYDDFIGSLDSFVPIGMTKDERKARIKNALRFLVRLGAGWIVGFISAVLVLTAFFQEHIYQVSSLFLGFIVFSIPLILKEELDSITGKYYNLIFTVSGAAIVVVITLLNPADGSSTAGTTGVFNYLFLFLTGMLAISAMVLPGISGSTILLIFGTYLPIMDGIKNLLHMNFSAVPELAVFALGIVAGVLLVIRLLKKGLEKFRPQMIYGILGLMLGSLYAVVRGPETLKNNAKPAMDLDTFSIVFFIIGAAIICGLQAVNFIVEKRRASIEENKE